MPRQRIGFATPGSAPAPAAELAAVPNGTPDAVTIAYRSTAGPTLGEVLWNGKPLPDSAWISVPVFAVRGLIQNAVARDRAEALKLIADTLKPHVVKTVKRDAEGRVLGVTEAYSGVTPPTTPPPRTTTRTTVIRDERDRIIGTETETV